MRREMEKMNLFIMTIVKGPPTLLSAFHDYTLYVLIIYCLQNNVLL